MRPSFTQVRKKRAGKEPAGNTNRELTITLGTPLANGASVDVRFLLGIQQTGNFKFYINIEDDTAAAAAASLKAPPTPDVSSIAGPGSATTLQTLQTLQPPMPRLFVVHRVWTESNEKPKKRKPAKKRLVRQVEN